MVRFRADLHRLRERGRAGGEEHELLEGKLVARVRSAVDDVEARDGEHVRWLHARELRKMLVQRHTLLSRAGLRDRDGHAEDRVRTELALVWRAVELDQEIVDALLVRHGQSRFDELGRDHVVHVRDRLEDTCAGGSVDGVR